MVIYILLCLLIPLSLQGQPTEQLIAGSLLGGAIGDAMGRPTEFLNMQKIKEEFPQGVSSFADFRSTDFWYDKEGNKFAPYTDDTRMAKVTFEVLVKARKDNWDNDATMASLAKAYIADMQHPEGWAARKRAPGMTCLKSVLELVRLEKREEQNKINSATGFAKDKKWWLAGEKDGGGCGSVMHAHPFGLVFWDNPKKAAAWAAEHSKITHGAPIARAACAAMAIGIAYAVAQKDPACIINKMIETAQTYDEATADMMAKAVSYAQINAPHEQVFQEFQGWAAHEAIAATIYIFAVAHDDLKKAIHLGVHTPGDSDSIASMAGALVGARVGINQIPTDWIQIVEDGNQLIRYAKAVK